MLPGNGLTPCHVHGALNDVSQFPHVSRPVILLQMLLGIAGKSWNTHAHLLVQPFEKAVRQKRDVLLALPERRHPNIDDIQPVLKILTENPV